MELLGGLDRLAFRFERIDPKAGLQRMISKVTAVRTVNSFIGIAILASAAWLLAGPLVVAWVTFQHILVLVKGRAVSSSFQQ
jgi:flagellar biosynthesis protein FlhB